MEILILSSILVLALLYSTVGHGGASGYLAVMALFGLEPQLLRSSALLLNVFVAGIAFVQYFRQGHFRWKLFFPFALASVPMAFIGGGLTLDPMIYKRILSVCLILAVIRILGLFGRKESGLRQLPFYAGIVVGAVLGFASGMIGIGGGIILSPVILLFHWANMKTTAAVSALFIFVNSVSGLIGMWSADQFLLPVHIYLWVAVAVAGGLAGSYFGSARLTGRGLKYVLACVLVFASYKLMVF